MYINKKRVTLPDTAGTYLAYALISLMEKKPIEEIQAALPDIKIMILEPLCLRAEATENTDEYPDKWNTFRTEVEKRALKARAVSEKYGLTFVPLQEKLDKAAETTENTYWLADGVHPTAMGHELIKREWLKAFETL